MVDKKLRAGVIGARLGASHAYAYANSSEYELVAVCDLFPKVMDELWDRAKLAKGSANTYTDYTEMFAKENLGVVSVPVPDHLHADPVVEAILCQHESRHSASRTERINQSHRR